MEKKIMHDQNMLDVKNIYKNFGSLKVLKGVSTTVDKGEVISIIGASGSGKSTLLRCMNLLEEPTFGEVWIEGKLMTPVDPYLHYDVIRASKTYKGLVAAGMEDMEAVMKIMAGQYVLLILKLGYFTNTTYGYIKWSRYIRSHAENDTSLF